MASIEHLVANLNTGDWESEIMEWARAEARDRALRLLEWKDEELAKHREPGLVVVGFRKRRVVTMFGDMVIRRFASMHSMVQTGFRSLSIGPTRWMPDWLAPP